MRLLPFAALAALTLPAAVQAQTCTGNITLTTQAEVDAFACETVSGNLQIEGADIVSLDSLSELTRVSVNLTVANNDLLANVDGLDNLTFIDLGSLDIRNNAVLTDLSGLGALTSVGNDLRVSDNPALTNVDGLDAITSAGGLLDIRRNDALTDLAGLAAITSVGSIYIEANAALPNVDGLAAITSIPLDITVRENAALTNLDGLGGITSVSRRIDIINNAALTNVDGLAALTSVGERFSIILNGALTDLDGLSALTSVGGDLDISTTSAPNFDGLAALTSVGGDLTIFGNGALTNIDGLAGITSIPGDLTIGINFDLTNIDGLAALTSVGGTLRISSSNALANVDGLAALTSVGGLLFIGGNRELTDLDGLAALTSVDGPLFIERNVSLTNVDGLAALTSAGGFQDGDAVGLSVSENGQLVRCAVGLGPILVLDRDGDGSAIDGPNTFQDNDPAGDCNSEQAILAAFEGSPITLPLADIAFTRGTCPATLPAGRASCRAEAGATLTAAQAQRFTVFLRLDGPAGFSRIAFRGEIQIGAGGTASQSIKLQSQRSDPAGAYTVTLVAELGSVPAPTAAAEDLGSFSITKAGTALRVAEPLAAFPNPAAGQATLRFAVTEAGDATLVLYDALGREVARPIDGAVDGLVEARLDAGALPAGLYVARLVTGNRAETVRLSVVR